MTEKTLERKLTLMVKKNGGIALKFISPGNAGMPDRILLFPDGKMAFVEMKAPGKKPRPLQISKHRFLTGLGFRVYVVDDEKQIKEIIDDLHTT